MKMDLRGSFVRGDTASVQSAEGRDRFVKNRFFFCSDHCCLNDHYHIVSSNQSEKSR